MNILFNMLVTGFVLSFSASAFGEIQCRNLGKELRTKYNDLVSSHVAKIQETNKLLTRQQNSKGSEALNLASEIAQKQREIQGVENLLSEFKKKHCPL